jgi:HEAT repeat protein
VQLLFSLVRDAAPGREASSHTSVNGRTRAFAGYALGLLLQRSRDLALSRRIVGGLLEELSKPAARDLTVAVIEALALFPADWAGTGPQVLRDSIVDGLGAYYSQDLGSGEQLVQAHVPPAISLQLRRNTPRIEVWKTRFAADLAVGMTDNSATATGVKVNPHIAQSCALALGALCEPWSSDKSTDAPHGRLLLRAYRDHRDQQVRSFALLSLGRMGGDMARTALLQAFPKAGRALEQPWIGMALGVLTARDLASAKALGRPAEPDPAVTTALREALQASRNPNAQGALAVALGLCQDAASADLLRELLRANSKRDDVAGYLCIALGLMQDDLATGEVRALLRTAERRPQLLLQSARALGLLGDHNVVDDLCRQIEDPEPSLMRLSAVASALGQIGDRRSLEPLVRMAQNDSLTPLTRAFAVVALGSICDKDPLPWNAAFASFTNYRAATETLTDGASGILDIL